MLDIDAKAYETFLKMGVPRSLAPCHGDPTGLYVALNTVDPETHTRTYAASAYFEPIATRSNLLVLTTAYVHRIMTENDGSGEIRATGVEFSYGGEPAVHVARTNREVIVSAGALKSPQILELSGIGRPDVLSKIGVPVKVALDGVGENVQEHQYIGVTYEVKAGASTETYDLLRDEKEAAKQLELYAKAEGIYMSGITNFVFMSLHDYTSKADAMYEAEKARVIEGIRNNKYPPGLAEQYEIQLERLRNKRTGPEMAVVPGFLSAPKPPEPGKQYLTIVAAVNHNFSRGTIHTASSDPLADPEMDPHYFEHDIDRQTFVALIQYIRRVTQTAPLSDFLGVELNPGPECDTDEKLAAWIPQGSGSTYHTAGSLSMLPREKNGVVDTSLKVYGTKNIRVVDLSIVPLHFAAHSQATVYAIAEQAADIIRGVSV
ncbi:gmc oxidoreductase [Moniliophthora roreri MCA 2997]|uniref:Gmc oxidoreductase n=2 Tax=Moniliophthora roreri TaxID=221103 RepID=V2XFS8_MONRO|nr:gmc oxidoreductase [Moniliophthora roreri MCA 2997]KAI3613008.1 gmc oxidoreductase [Moniliophthora roreri]